MRDGRLSSRTPGMSQSSIDGGQSGELWRDGGRCGWHGSPARTSDTKRLYWNKCGKSGHYDGRGQKDGFSYHIRLNGNASSGGRFRFGSIA